MRLILFIAALYVWWPRYDLFISNTQGVPADTKVEDGFLTLGACAEAARRYRTWDWICMKWSPWSEWTNDFTKYDSKHR